MRGCCPAALEISPLFSPASIHLRSQHIPISASSIIHTDTQHSLPNILYQTYIHHHVVVLFQPSPATDPGQAPSVGARAVGERGKSASAGLPAASASSPRTGTVGLEATRHLVSVGQMAPSSGWHGRRSNLRTVCLQC